MPHESTLPSRPPSTRPPTPAPPPAHAWASQDGNPAGGLVARYRKAPDQLRHWLNVHDGTDFPALAALPLGKMHNPRTGWRQFELSARQFHASIKAARSSASALHPCRAHESRHKRASAFGFPSDPVTGLSPEPHSTLAAAFHAGAVPGTSAHPSCSSALPFYWRALTQSSPSGLVAPLGWPQS